MSEVQQNVEQEVRQRTADLIRSNENLRLDTCKLRAEGERLRQRLTELSANLKVDQAARLAALNLMEDAVTARNAELLETEERRRSETALRVSEDRLQLALNAAAMGTFIWHVQADRTELDSRMLALFELPEGEAVHLKSDLAAMIHPDDRERYLRSMARACDPLSSGELREDVRVMLPGGGQRWLAITGQVFFAGEPPAPERMAGVVADITSRKVIEGMLRESESRQAFLLKLSDALRTLSDPQEIQAAAARVLGQRLNVSRALYAEVEHGEDSDYYVIHQDYHKPDVSSLVGRHRANDFGATLFNEMRAGRTLAVADVDTEPRITHQERQAYPALDIRAYVGVPLCKDGRHVAIFGMLQTTPRAWTHAEISLLEETAERTWASVERARAESALRDAKAAADHANRAKDRFLAVLSHELRTPLTPVLMMVGALTQDKNLPSDLREDLAMVQRNVELETKLIDDLLDLSRMGSGKVVLKMSPLDLNKVVQDTCASCRPQATERSLEIKCQLDPAAGSLSADPVRLQQALWNILRNAMKFTPSHGHIEVSTARPNGTFCEVRVRDNGIGIPPEKLSRIFDAFEQGDANVTRLYGGLGLGLAITKGLVELHGGTIRAESDGAGKGACFVMQLPAG